MQTHAAPHEIAHFKYRLFVHFECFGKSPNLDEVHKCFFNPIQSFFRVVVSFVSRRPECKPTVRLLEHHTNRVTSISTEKEERDGTRSIWNSTERQRCEQVGFEAARGRMQGQPRRHKNHVGLQITLSCQN